MLGVTRTARTAIASAAPVVALLLLLPLLWLPAGQFDEAAIVQAAVTILHGGLPYRDFWSIYPPGTHYLAAGLFAVFGTSLTVSRIADLVLRLAVVVVIGRIARRIGGQLAFAASTVAGALALFQVGPGLLPITVGFALVLLATDLVLDGRPGRAVAAGLIVGVSIAFRHDLAAYAVIAHLVGLWRSRPALSGYLAALVGSSCLLVLVAALTLPILAMVDAVLLVPAAIYPHVRRLPYPPTAIPLVLPMGPLALEFFTPPLIARMLAWLLFVATAASLAVAWRRQCLPALVLGVLGVASLNIAVVRRDYIHLAAAALPVVALGPALLRNHRRWKFGFWVTSTLLIVVLGEFGFIRLRPLVPSECVHASGSHAVDRRLGSACAALDELAVAALLTRSSDPLFVALPTHDRLVTNDILLYFLAGRLSVTAWYDVHPGVTTTAGVQNAIVGALTKHPEAAVIGQPATEMEEPNASSQSSGVHLLDDYLRTTYETDYRVGRYVILRRRKPL